MLWRPDSTASRLLGTESAFVFQLFLSFVPDHLFDLQTKPVFPSQWPITEQSKLEVRKSHARILYEFPGLATWVQHYQILDRWLLSSHGIVFVSVYAKGYTGGDLLSGYTATGDFFMNGNMIKWTSLYGQDGQHVNVVGLQLTPWVFTTACSRLMEVTTSVWGGWFFIEIGGWMEEVHVTITFRLLWQPGPDATAICSTDGSTERIRTNSAHVCLWWIQTSQFRFSSPSPGYPVQMHLLDDACKCSA